MTAEQIVQELKSLGQDSYKKVLLNHGIQEPCYGVKIEEMKKIQKRIKKDYQLALDLYNTGHLRRHVPGRADCRRFQDD
jgi:3-methyladenine DNA glycosylase AlkD